jgi:hypothetical protein
VATSPQLLTLLSELSPSARSWLERTLADRALLSNRLRLRAAFTQLPRRLGDGAGTRTAEASGSSLRDGIGDLPATCTNLDLARLALIRAALWLHPASEHVAVVEELYRTGEQREQESVLRMLAMLPEPERFTMLAVNACRTNSVAVFTAIAHDNAFPAAYFPELSFNQLVLKAIFLGVRVARINGLPARVNNELRRMLEGYASERRAAGRPVPDDVSAVLAL